MERHCAIKRYTMKHVCGPSCKKYATAAQKATNTARCRHRFFRFYRILRPQQTLHLHLQSAEELDALHPHNKLRGFKLHGRKVVRKGRQGGYRHIFPGAILTKVRDIVLGLGLLCLRDNVLGDDDTLRFVSLSRVYNIATRGDVWC